MEYKIIKSSSQYDQYCKKLQHLLKTNPSKNEDEIELLTLLIEKYDEENYQYAKLDPIQMIKALMESNNLKSKDLVEILNLTKGTVSKMLNYQKGLSKETIRTLANHFKLSQEAFNRPYKLKNPINKKFKDASLMNTKKQIREVEHST